MPMVNGVAVTADEAYAKGLCPECADDLRAVNLQDHVQQHWPALDPRNGVHREAARRADMIRSFKQ